MSEAALTQLVEHAKISKALKEKLINFGRNKDKESDELKGKILKLNADHGSLNLYFFKEYFDENFFYRTKMS